MRTRGNEVQTLKLKTGREEKMKNAKRMVAAGTMMGVIVFGATLANAGIIIAGKESSQCGGTSKKNDLTGIIIAGVVAARTGIIIAGRESVRTNCGIIIAG